MKTKSLMYVVWWYIEWSVFVHDFAQGYHNDHTTSATPYQALEQDTSQHQELLGTRQYHGEQGTRQRQKARLIHTMGTHSPRPLPQDNTYISSQDLSLLNQTYKISDDKNRILIASSRNCSLEELDIQVATLVDESVGENCPNLTSITMTG